MPGIDELLRAEGERWRTEVDAHHEPSTAVVARPGRRPWTTHRGRVWTVSIGGVAAAAVVVLAIGLSSGSGSDGSNGSSQTGDAAIAGPAIASRAASGGYGTDTTTAPSASGSTPASTALILTGSLSLTVPDNADVDRAATRATGIADGAGGRVDADSRSADGKNRSATLVLRVPNAALPAVTKQLSALGTVTSQELQTKDVTAQVADVDSRVTSARAAIAALDRLYAKAQSVKDLITVESALAARQADLEALEAQQRALTAQTSLATLNLSIDVHHRAAVKHHDHRSGFTGGLHHGWHAFTATAGGLATAAGAALPFAVVLLLAGAATVLVRRGRRRRHRTA